MAARRQTHPARPIRSSPAARQWLLLVHQLPPKPTNLRVRTWRRLQQLGAVALKQSVYVLPDTPEGREDFEWLKTEIAGAGGDAAVLTGHHLDNWSDDALVEEFRQLRQDDYAALAADIDAALKRAARARQPKGSRAPALHRLSDIFGERFAAIEKIDFFGSAGRDRVVALLDQLKREAGGTKPAGTAGAANGDLADYQARLWVTRPRPGVDRMASAWLIRRFIDAKARFAFADDKASLPGDGVAFDMFGVEFSHQGEGCTFETLCSVFGIADAAVTRLSAIVHDLDLKDGKFGAAEAPTVATLIDGLQLAHADDHDLLEHGITLFESLYRSFSRQARSARPRAIARRKQ
jgi:hypothetical protein